MRLQHQLVLPQARYLGHKTVPTKEEPKVFLAFRTSLTREVAEAFGCRDLIFAGDVPRSGVDSMKLEGSELDCEMHLRHDNLAFNVVANEIGHYVAKLEGDGVKLDFRIRLTGYAQIGADLATQVKIDPLEITLRPAQLDLGLQGENPSEEGNCVDCANEVPLEDGDPSTHKSGQPCGKFRPAESTDGPAIASVTEMGVGSHQKGNPKKHGRRRPEPEPEPEEEKDFISEVIQ